ncbi:hypothetical protein D3874_18700 [Oleomonas cavernae]|uniref:Uncharacterized protein n=1 Tax=Oleomonas cavernae TaxID=2320859 RepID=A0A418WFH4_9PROT|nr:hypothetical protein [Oleomonas cavernae]RJF88768.1 hypothetical protein D3874_18700 [Oleomonas cavernae]
MSNAQYKTAVAPAARLQAYSRVEGAIAPVLMAAAFSAIGGFGVMLAAKAPDDYGYVAGFGFLMFAFVMAMRYFGNRV